ncbi:cytochrome p450 [Stylonychia lemnae]|uniref:Cytochrome p450 n=1 Tax=Stylonychia lemnae TaxID=5949 RepID=A0A078A422_STYLE|nr:cytochrome p450 [Stylonychia lemnae]|eukprot:CDW76273.1 cytochrome p450 [Stylonychia lemnae]
MPSTRFPLPIIGNALKILEVARGANEYTDQILYRYYINYFESIGQDVPPVFIDFLSAEGQIVVSDPDMLQELFVTKGKFVDKYSRLKVAMHKLTGESIIFEATTEEQAMKRKRLSSAFYKDKMTLILKILVKKTYDWVNILKQDVKDGKKEIELSKLVNDHITDCILTSVFGDTKLNKTLEYEAENSREQISLGVFVGNLFSLLVRRFFGPLRQFTQIFDRVFVGKQEKRLERNIDNYRNFLNKFIEERREQMKDPNFISGDFLTLLLSDEHYKNDDKLIKDEISTFMLAATQTTASLITNLLYYQEFIPEIKQKLMTEIAQIMSNDKNQGQLPLQKMSITCEQWIEKLGYDQLQESWQYLYLVIQENLRIESPVRSSTPLQLRQKMNISGFEIDTDIPILVHFHLLHRNPKEWIEPTKFIPERFDPLSKYSLAPDGSKRKPLSFSPFLGGRRICLGKTFAENIAKLVVPIFISELEFTFKKDYHYQRKPPKGLSTEVNVPIILSLVKKD